MKSMKLRSERAETLPPPSSLGARDCSVCVRARACVRVLNGVSSPPTQCPLKRARECTRFPVCVRVRVCARVCVRSGCFLSSYHSSANGRRAALIRSPPAERGTRSSALQYTTGGATRKQTRADLESDPAVRAAPDVTHVGKRPATYYLLVAKPRLYISEGHMSACFYECHHSLTSLCSLRSIIQSIINRYIMTNTYLYIYYIYIYIFKEIYINIYIYLYKYI